MASDAKQSRGAERMASPRSAFARYALLVAMTHAATRAQHSDSDGQTAARRHASAFPRRQCARAVEADHPRRKEGAGKVGCRSTPMARLQQRTQAAVTTGTSRSSGLPCAMVLTLIRDLLGDRAFLPPSRPGSSPARLASASRCQDHTLSQSGPIASSTHRKRARPARPSHPTAHVP